MQKANINVRIDPVIKEKAQTLLTTFGLDMTTAVNLFLNQLVLHSAIPFPIAMPESPPLKVKQPRLLGGMEGKIWMADDFDAPLDDFKEYME
jgi:addiction module RelB/DinJ family antitoxin